MGVVHSVSLGDELLNTFNILVVNVFLFIVFLNFFIVTASRVCKRLLLLFLYMIIALLIRIFLMSGDLSLSVSLLCYVIICCFIRLILEKWLVRRQESVVVVWPM